MISNTNNTLNSNNINELDNKVKNKDFLKQTSSEQVTNKSNLKNLEITDISTESNKNNITNKTVTFNENPMIRDISIRSDTSLFKDFDDFSDLSRVSEDDIKNSIKLTPEEREHFLKMLGTYQHNKNIILENMRIELEREKLRRRNRCGCIIS